MRRLLAILEHARPRFSTFAVIGRVRYVIVSVGFRRQRVLFGLVLGRSGTIVTSLTTSRGSRAKIWRRRRRRT